jgi:hypothetical protein
MAALVMAAMETPTPTHSVVEMSPSAVSPQTTLLTPTPTLGVLTDSPPTVATDQDMESTSSEQPTVIPSLDLDMDICLMVLIGLGVVSLRCIRCVSA